MSSKLFTTRWGLACFLILFSQCTKCFRKNYISMRQQTLAWQPAKPLSVPLPDNLDLQKGITCHVATEQATYYLNPTGEGWKFMQTAEGPTYEELPTLPEGEKADAIFAFVAGPTLQEGILHVGAVRKDEGILIYQRTEESWKEVGDFDFAEVDVQDVQDGYVDAAACTIQVEEESGDELHGLIALRYNSKDPTAMLVYEPLQAPSAEEGDPKKDENKNTDGADDKEKDDDDDQEEHGKLVRDTDWHYEHKTRFPTKLLEIAPSKVVLFYHSAGKTYAQLLVEKEGSQYDEHIFRGEESERQTIFLLRSAEHPAFKQVCIATHVKKTEPAEHVVPEFYLFAEGSKTETPSFQPTEEVEEAGEDKKEDSSEEEEENEEQQEEEEDTKPPVDHSNSLVLPFGTSICLITQNDEGEAVYYECTLAAPAKKR